MKKIFLLISFLTSLSFSSVAQTDSPYKMSWKVDGPITGAGMALSGVGLYLVSKKDGFSDSQVNSLNKKDINGFDRFTAGNYDLDAKSLSDLGFYGSFTTPLLLLFDGGIRSNAGQVAALYVETMSVTGTIFTMAAGNVYRARPFTYNTSVPISERKTKNARNSFFAGHTAATASATFFLAKVFNDFNPDSPAKPFVWAAAAALPAGVGYLRLKAGKHFLSDNLIGYAVGSSVGILIPHLHKKSSQLGLSITPVSDYITGDGIALNYKF